MTIDLTARNIFNTPDYDADAMLRKAERELDRLRLSQTFDEMYDHMLNCSVTLAAVCDWTFHLRLRTLPQWSGKNEKHFTNWVRLNCADAFVFIDISNEYKHANRNKPSTLAKKMMLSYVDLTARPQQRAWLDLTRGWMYKKGTDDVFVYPSIIFNDQWENFHDAAERAISWWKAFEPSSAQPTSS